MALIDARVSLLRPAAKTFVDTTAALQRTVQQVAAKPVGNAVAQPLAPAPSGKDWLAQTSALLDQRTGTKTTRGNVLTPIIGGENVFPELLKTIDGAQRTLYYQAYNFREGDASTKQIVDRLIAAQRRGVAVRVVADAFGARVIPFVSRNDDLDRLKAAGVDVQIYNPIDLSGDLNRNHSKSVIADNSTAWIGGVNTGDEWMSPNPQGRFHDMMARARGPMLRDVLKQFYESYEQAGGPKLPAAEQAVPPISLPQAGSNVRVLTHQPGKPNPIQAAYLTLINSAQRNINIETGFGLTQEVIDALSAAAKRGVTVNYIVDGTSGMRATWLGRSAVDELSRAGANVYLYQGPVHTKALSVDGRIATVGSSNFDGTSLIRNREIVAVVEDPAFAQRIDELLFNPDVLASRKAA